MDLFETCRTVPYLPVNPLLVSTHIVCERLSVMQELAWVRGSCAQNPKFTLFLVNPPPQLELLMDDLGSLGLRLPRIPPNENWSGLLN